MRRELDEFERLIRRDPGGRGLLGPESDLGIGAGELHGAASLLASAEGAVGIVTGFFIPSSRDEGDHCRAPSGHAETDGPPGSALLARVLTDFGRRVKVITDINCGEVVAMACRAQGCVEDCVVAAPLESSDWRREFMASDFGREMRTLVAIERVGPSYTSAALLLNSASDVDVALFESEVAPSERSHCFNMRGVNIDEFTGDLHELFDEVTNSHSGSCVIGIGDGGNEIGMGRFSWTELRRRLPAAVGSKIPCRISADRTILAGTSNWGAYALAAAVAVISGRSDVIAERTVAEQQLVIEAIVRAGAVDGVTRRAEPTVDGLPFLTYIQPWVGIRRAMGFSS